MTPDLVPFPPNLLERLARLGLALPLVTHNAQLLALIIPGLESAATMAARRVMLPLALIGGSVSLIGALGRDGARLH